MKILRLFLLLFIPFLGFGQDHFNLGLDAYYSGNYNEAVNNYNRALKKDKKNYLIYYNRGIAYFYLQNFKKAIKDYSRSIKLNGNFPDAHINRGLAYMLSKSNGKSMADFTRAIALDTVSYTAYYNRGILYYNLGKYPEAERDLKRSMRIKSDYVNAEIYIGLIRFQQRNYQGAADIFSHCISVDPGMAIAYFNRGLANARLEKKDQACEDFQRAFELGYAAAATQMKGERCK